MHSYPAGIVSLCVRAAPPPPHLQALYQAPGCSDLHIFLSLILLKLSEDELFNQKVHSCMLQKAQVTPLISCPPPGPGGLVHRALLHGAQSGGSPRPRPHADSPAQHGQDEGPAPAQQLSGSPGQHERSFQRSESLCGPGK